MGRLEDELERGRKEAARREKGQEQRDDDTRLAEIVRRIITGKEHPMQKRIREMAEKFAKENK